MRIGEPIIGTPAGRVLFLAGFKQLRLPKLREVVSGLSRAVFQSPQQVSVRLKIVVRFESREVQPGQSFDLHEDVVEDSPRCHARLAAPAEGVVVAERLLVQQERVVVDVVDRVDRAAVIVTDELRWLIQEFAAWVGFGRRTFVRSLSQIDEVAEDEHAAPRLGINRDRLAAVSGKRIQRARDEVLIDQRRAASFLWSRFDAVVVEVVHEVVMELQPVQSVERDAVVMVGQLAMSDLEVAAFGKEQIPGTGSVFGRRKRR